MSDRNGLSSLLTACGLEESELPRFCPPSTRVFVDRELRAEIRPEFGGRVELTCHNGFISRSWRGWHVSFGPGTPPSVLIGAVRAARDSLTSRTPRESQR